MVMKSKKSLVCHLEKTFDTASIKTALDERLIYSVGKESINATTRDWYTTAAYVVRDRLIDRWMQTMSSYYEANAKRVYYLSMEFLMGRSLMNSLHNLEVEKPAREALQELGIELEKLRDEEYDAATVGMPTTVGPQAGAIVVPFEAAA